MISLAVLFAVGACSTTDDSNGSGGGGTSDVVDSDATELDTTPDPSCTAEWIARITGEVLDEAGEPVEGAKAQLCLRVAPNDVLRCLAPVDADSSGAFVADIPDGVRCSTEATVRTLAPGTDNGTMYCHVDISGGNPIVEIEASFILYSTVPATGLPDMGDSASERAVTFADGLEIDVVPDRYYAPGDGYGKLAARRLDGVASELCFLEGAPTLDGLYALSPEGDVDGASFPIRIPNTSSLAANSDVALYVLGGLDTRLPDDSTIPEATWQEYGTGTVSSDGTTIEGELPYFSWFGYRGL